MELISFLKERMPRLAAEERFSFSAHTTVGCGGYAEAAVSPACTEELLQLLILFKREKIGYCLLGAGANVLPSDADFAGVVVRFRALDTLFCDGENIFAGAGVTGGRLLRFARACRLSGFEPFTGIPMTVGGAAAMNAGVRDRHFADVVTQVVAVEAGAIRIFSPSECRFSDKDSLFLQEKLSVAAVWLRGSPSDEERILKNRYAYAKRREHLPKGRSMGCTFVNPAGQSAGKLIEACGLKGRTVGKVRVSERHANFLINEGSSAADVAQLIAEVKEEVRRRTGIELREEIRRLT